MQNKWPILKDNLALQLGFVALLLYTILLPFQPLFPPITSGIIAFWLVYIFSFNKERLALILPNQYALIWVGYYSLLLLGLLQTSNLEDAENDLVLKITLILWPLGFASWPDLILKNKQPILTVFAFTTVASAIILSAVGIFRWVDSGTASNQLFLYMNVWEAIPNHYMALYASFSILILLHLFLKKQLALPYLIMGSSALLVLIALTGVRVQFLALPFAILIFFVLQKESTHLKRNMVKYISLSLLVLSLVAFVIPSSRARLLETIDEVKSINGMVNNKQTNHRVFLWKYGFEVIEDNFWIGTGTADEDAALAEKMKKCDAKFWNGTRLYKINEVPFNYHNAFLQQFASHGILGFLLLIALFILPFYDSKTDIKALSGAFLALCFVAFLTESMLERQAGVLFFGFFYSLLFVANSSIKGK